MMGAITGAIAWEDYGNDRITPEMKNIWMKTEQHLMEKTEKQAAQFDVFCKKE